MRSQHLELLESTNKGFGLGSTEFEGPVDPRGDVEFMSLQHYF